MVRHHVLLELLLIGFLSIYRVLTDLSFKFFPSLRLFGFDYRLFLVICESFWSKIGPLVIHGSLVLMIFHHLIKMVVLDQLLAILLLQVSMCLLFNLVFGQFFVD